MNTSIVTAFWARLIARQVNDKGLVVWYERGQAYGSSAELTSPKIAVARAGFNRNSSRLRRAANLHLEPDLNDGVVLNIAPPWELVPWKEARKYWDELMDGQHECSSIGKQLREKGLVRT